MDQGTDLRIRTIQARDIRWPTSASSDGSDAMHVDPDYSCVYVTVLTDRGVTGHGLTFTIGRGTDVVLLAVETLADLLRNRNAGDIFKNFGDVWRELTSESQLRWVSVIISF